MAESVENRSVAGPRVALLGRASWLLEPLALAYRLGVGVRALAYRRRWILPRQLSSPVVSIGNLTAGGTGKTPLVAAVAEILTKRGLRPGILTRGYRRQSTRRLLVIEPGPGTRPDPREVGDEPALLARLLPEVPLVVCASRFAGGRVAEELFRVDVHLLDDGFQHLQLARDLDIVALDTTQKLSDWALIPAGRQREPRSALKRAHLVVLTRVDLADPAPLERRVRRLNPVAGIFHSRLRLTDVVPLGDKAASGPSLETLKSQPVGAFCALGNPAAYFASLRRWGFSLVMKQAFPDHHVFSAAELARLSDMGRRAGACALLASEKDFMNLPAEWPAGLPIFACATRLEVIESEAFEAALLSRLESASRTP
jgi:tetraacyldisaccharide 4'-kinase